MPPAPRPVEGETGQVVRASDTRALLSLLQDLRDSLSVRVHQLAAAVERLRAQAGELERGLEASGASSGEGSGRRFSGALQPPDHHNTSPHIEMPDQPPAPAQAYTSTSAIASEVSQLDRPITSAEIHRLLDRASASLAATPDIALDDAEREGTIEGLRQARDSLQGGIAELQGMGETQARLRQRLRERREMLLQAEADLRGERIEAEDAANRVHARPGVPRRVVQPPSPERGQAMREQHRRLWAARDTEEQIAARSDTQMQAVYPGSPTWPETPQSQRRPQQGTVDAGQAEVDPRYEAERRLAAIRTRQQHGTERAKKESRAERLARRERTDRAGRIPKPARSGLAPTNSVAVEGSTRATMIGSKGVEPPPPHTSAKARIPRRARNAVSNTPSAPPAIPGAAQQPPARSPATHLDTASLDAIQSQISELDLTLEPSEYMTNLSRIIRRAMIPPASGAGSASTAGGDGLAGISMMIIDTNGQVLHNTLPGWGPPESPSSPSSSVGSTVLGNAADAALTYRGRDVQDRLRSTENGSGVNTGATTPDINGLLGEELGREAVRRIQDRVAAMMEPAAGSISRTTPEASSRVAGGRPRPADDTSRALVSVAARSARELVRAASRREADAPTPIPLLDRLTDRSTTYETIAQAELRLAQAQRTRAYNRYQDLISSRGRREPRPSGSASTSRMLRRSTAGLEEAGAESGAGDDGLGVPDLARADDPDEADARQELVVAQMREGRAQQRLIWARSRLRRDPASSSPSGAAQIGASSTSVGRLDDLQQRMIEADQQIDELRADILHAQEMADSRRRERTITVGSDNENIPPPVRTEGDVLVGPRDEQPEDVDTLVRIRQLQADRARDRPRAIERVEARRLQLAAMRQDLADSRRRIREAAESAISESTDLAPAVDLDSDGDQTMRQLLDDARQVSEARQALMLQVQAGYDGLDDGNGEVTPSSPHTAQTTRDFGHIQISTETDTRTERRASARVFDLFGPITAEEMAGATDSDSHGGREGADEAVRGDGGGGAAASADEHHALGDRRPTVRDASETAQAGQGRRNVQQGPARKSTLECLNGRPVTVDNASIQADVWEAPPRSRRRERVYISLLDL